MKKKRLCLLWKNSSYIIDENIFDEKRLRIESVSKQTSLSQVTFYKNYEMRHVRIRLFLACFALFLCSSTLNNFQLTISYLQTQTSACYSPFRWEEEKGRTSSGSEGNREKKSASSLLSMKPFGLRNLLVNLLITNAKIKARSGT